MRQPIAIINARGGRFHKQITYYKLETVEHAVLPYKVTLYNKDNIALYVGLFASHETAEAYAQDKIDMTTPLY